MSEKTANLLKAAFGAFVGIGCLCVEHFDKSHGGGHFTYLGAILGFFIAFSFARRAFEK